MGRRILVLGIALLFGAGTAQGQSISGTLTDAVTGLPLGNIPILKPIYGVQVVGVDGKFVTQVFTLQNGTYQADVPAGTYFVWAFALGNYHVPELYNNLPCIAADCVYTAARRSSCHQARRWWTSRSGGLVAFRGRCGRPAVRRSSTLASSFTTRPGVPPPLSSQRAKAFTG